jgi:hypothetical protein
MESDPPEKTRGGATADRYRARHEIENVRRFHAAVARLRRALLRTFGSSPERIYEKILFSVQKIGIIMLDFEAARHLLEEAGLNNEENAPVFAEDGCTELIDENGNVIHLFYDQSAETLAAVGAIGKLPEDKDEALAVTTYLLSQNLLWVNTHGATLALVREGSYAALQRRYEGGEESVYDFKNFLGSFSDELAQWIEAFGKIAAQAEEGRSSLEFDFV